MIDPDSFASPRSTGSAAPGRRRRRRRLGVGREPLDGTVSRIDRPHEPVVDDPRRRRAAALAFGGGSLWVADGDARNVAQIDPGSNKVLQRIAAGERAAVAARWRRARSGWSPALDGSVRRIDLAPRRFRADPPRREPDRCRRRRRSDLGDERGGRDRRPPRSPLRRRRQLGQRRQRADRRRDGRGRGVGREPRATARSRASTPRTNAVSGIVHVGARPAGGRRGRGSVWVAGGEDGNRRPRRSRAAARRRAARHRQQPDCARGRRRLGVDGGGGAAGRPPRGHAAGPRRPVRTPRSTG